MMNPFELKRSFRPFWNKQKWITYVLQFLKRLKLYTKLVLEALCELKLKYLHQNFIYGHMHITINCNSIFLQLEHRIEMLVHLSNQHVLIVSILRGPKWYPSFWYIVIKLEHATHIMYYRKIVKQRKPQNKLFGLCDHTIDFIDSFWFWVSLVTL